MDLPGRRKYNRFYGWTRGSRVRGKNRKIKWGGGGEIGLNKRMKG